MLKTFYSEELEQEQILENSSSNTNYVWAKDLTLIKKVEPRSGRKLAQAISISHRVRNFNKYGQKIEGYKKVCKG